jgi:hypothetical protein
LDLTELLKGRQKMNTDVNTIKADIFDILVEQDRRKLEIQELDKMKQEKLKQLEELLKKNAEEKEKASSEKSST